MATRSAARLLAVAPLAVLAVLAFVPALVAIVRIAREVAAGTAARRPAVVASAPSVRALRARRAATVVGPLDARRTRGQAIQLRRSLLRRGRRCLRDGGGCLAGIRSSRSRSTRSGCRCRYDWWRRRFSADHRGRRAGDGRSVRLRHVVHERAGLLASRGPDDGRHEGESGDGASAEGEGARRGGCHGTDRILRREK